MHEHIRQRLLEPAPTHLGAIDGSLPVVSFGDFLSPSVRVATVALNPSSAEFWGAKGKWLAPDKTRLASRFSLGLSAHEPLKDDHLHTVLHTSNTYFSGNPLTRWFRPLNDILVDVCGGDYWAGTACHLDLVQWATHPVQGQLGDRWPELVRADREFLRWQIVQTPATVLVLNGAGVVRELERNGVISDVSTKEFGFSLPSGRSWPLRVVSAQAMGKRVIGWNQVIARVATWPVGARACLVDEIARLAR